MSPHTEVQSEENSKEHGAASQSPEVASSSQGCRAKRQTKSTNLHQLIGHAILQSFEGKLTLAKLYEQLSKKNPEKYNPDTFSWYGGVRHCLTTRECFVNIKREKDDAGHGGYWTIKDGQESVFFETMSTQKSARGQPCVVPTPSRTSSPITIPTTESAQAPPALYSSLGPSPSEQTFLQMLASHEISKRKVALADCANETQLCPKRLALTLKPDRQCGRAEEVISRIPYSYPKITSIYSVSIRGLTTSSRRRQYPRPRTKTPLAPIPMMTQPLRSPIPTSTNTTLSMHQTTSRRGPQSTPPRLSDIGEIGILYSPLWEACDAKNAADESPIRSPVFAGPQDSTLMNDPLDLGIDSMHASFSVKQSAKQTSGTAEPDIFVLGDITNSVAQGLAPSTPLL